MALGIAWPLVKLLPMAFLLRNLRAGRFMELIPSDPMERLSLNI